MKKLALQLFAFLTLGLALSVNAQYPGWSQYYIVERVTSLAADDNYSWVGSNFGVVRIDNTSGVETYFNYANSGLPSNNVNSIAVDDEGTTFVGTTRGLAIYDGSSWTVYDSLNSPLPGNNIKEVAVDITGAAWIALDSALLVLDEFNDFTVAEPELIGLPSSRVDAVAIGSDYSIWIGSGSLVAGNLGMGWSVFDLADEGILTDAINCIVVDSAGHAWIGTNDGLARYAGNRWVIYNTTNSELHNNTITSLAVDEDNNLYIGNYTGGLVKFDGLAFTRLGSPVEYEFDSTFFALASVNGSLWVGGNTGLSIYDDGQWTFRHLANAPLPSNRAWHVAVDHDNVKWFGYSSEGLLSFDGSTWALYDTSNSDIPGNTITALGVDEQNEELWVGTVGGLATFDGNAWTLRDSTADKIARAIAVADDGVVWVASNQGLESFDGNQWTTHEYITNTLFEPGAITDMEFDNDGTLWIATTWDGMVSFDGTNWQNYKSGDGVPADWVLSIAVDSSNTVWIGTNYAMLASFDGTQWTSYDVGNDPYFDNWIMALVIDDSNTKWMGAKGSSRVNALSTLNDTTLTVLNSLNSGFPQEYVEAMAIDKQGTIWIASRGIYSVSRDIQVSIDDHRLPAIEVSAFPNPSTGMVHFNTLDRTGITRVEIIATNGRIVMSKAINGERGSLSLDQLPAGLYLMRLKTASGMVVKKIIKH